jgi:hypothetical protein
MEISLLWRCIGTCAESVWQESGKDIPVNEAKKWSKNEPKSLDGNIASKVG